ncbi:tetratricopeptide repeat protein [Flavobacteriaceae bacterium R38]|nr:tetratricopeptide repeat protein [Flavobacteriaceae bacterium R38]
MKILSTIFAILITQSILLGQNNVLDRAQKMLEDKKHDQVIELLSSQKNDFKSNAQYFYLTGSAYIDKLQVTDNFFKKGTLASKAKSALLKAIELQPSHIDARVRLSNYYLNAPVIAGGSNTKAKQQATEIMKYDQKRGRMLLASIHYNKKDFKAAEKEYLSIYKIAPEDERIRYLLSNIYFEMKQYDKAFNYCKQSINKFPDYLTGHYQYGRIASVAKKNIDQGIAYLNHFLEKSPADGQPKKHWAYYRLALLKKEQGKTVASQQALKKALELYPDFSQAKKLLN